MLYTQGFPYSQEQKEDQIYLSFLIIVPSDSKKTYKISYDRTLESLHLIPPLEFQWIKLIQMFWNYVFSLHYHLDLVSKSYIVMKNEKSEQKLLIYVHLWKAYRDTEKLRKKNQREKKTKSYEKIKFYLVFQFTKSGNWMELQCMETQ